MALLPWIHARALSQAGVTVAVATLGPRASADQRKEASGIDGLELIETDAPLDWLCERRHEVTQAATAIAALARDFGADLVQLNGAALAGEAEFAAPAVAVHHSCLATWWANVKGGPLPADWLWRRELMRDHLLSSMRCLRADADLRRGDRRKLRTTRNAAGDI